jgi:hypothetical protein
LRGRPRILWGVQQWATSDMTWQFPGIHKVRVQDAPGREEAWWNCRGSRNAGTSTEKMKPLKFHGSKSYTVSQPEWHTKTSPGLFKDVTQATSCGLHTIQNTKSETSWMTNHYKSFQQLSRTWPTKTFLGFLWTSSRRSSMHLWRTEGLKTEAAPRHGWWQVAQQGPQWGPWARLGKGDSQTTSNTVRNKGYSFYRNTTHTTHTLQKRPSEQTCYAERTKLSKGVEASMKRVPPTSSHSVPNFTKSYNSQEDQWHPISEHWTQDKPWCVTIDTGKSVTVARPDITRGSRVSRMSCKWRPGWQSPSWKRQWWS